MPLSEKEVKELKTQLKEQVKHLPPQQKQLAEQQIDTMSPEAIETMLEQQKSQQVKIFRQIANKEIPAAIIAENQHALAVLEIRPLSKGHTIIIPKKEITDPKALPKEVQELARETSKKLGTHLKPKTLHEQTEVKFGEAIIDLIPEYDTPIKPTAERKQTTPEELQALAKELKKEIIPQRAPLKKIKVQKKKQEKVLKLRRHTP